MKHHGAMKNCRGIEIVTKSNQALVSIVTPVYNCEPYLAECIESVLAQTYSNWKYTIVNNCSTDRSLEIARDYASQDRRITVHDNTEFLDVIGNANNAFRQISADSKYCKSVSGDDWIYPECLERMVAVAEQNPTVGIVGAYQVSGSGVDGRQWRVRWTEVPYGRAVIPGREIARSHLLGGPYVFGSPTSLLYRSDLVRSHNAFYPNSSAHADTSACYMCLRDTDFGFVYQVLSYERIHGNAVSTACRDLNTYSCSRLGDLIEYGPSYLSESELTKRLEELLQEYYTFLGVSVYHNRGRDFWRYHRQQLQELGHPFSVARLSRAAMMKFLDLALNPKGTAEKILKGRGGLGNETVC
jgi:glycosyltransferase involved in cell wall biosynthesis